MKIAAFAIAGCLLLFAALTESGPAPGQEAANGTEPVEPVEAASSVSDRFFAFQDQVRNWADQLSQRTRSAFQRLQVQEVNKVMSSWFSELGKRFGGKKTQ